MLIKSKKISLGQFFTKNHFWLKGHILDFIKSTNANIAFDPFAGNGDLLEVSKKIGFKKIKGLDIDKDLKWSMNDSLLNIPKVKNSVIITNPPYLTNYSAKRRGVYKNVKKYFNTCHYDDIYKLAIEKCMENNDFGVMIVPETFINSRFPKNRLASITIIEDLMFDDTENPVCVLCFDKKNKTIDKVRVYKNNKHLGHLKNFEMMRKVPQKNIQIKFNTLGGQIALRAVDTTNINKQIEFMAPAKIDYDLSTIKISSRLITLIEVDVEKKMINKLIKQSNQILFNFREKTHDILLSPFKGNQKNGKRRRRLDYKTARAILEEAYNSITPPTTLF
jgi:hypothetical protein